MTNGSRWFEEAFRADYRRVYPHRDLAAARREADFLLARGVGGRVLDLCCGFGRHALLLRGAGVSAFGLDLSQELLLGARELPRFDELLRGRLVRGDSSRLPFRRASLDCVVSLFSSFGYLGDDGDARALAEVARVLCAGGLALFDLMNPARVRATLVPHSERSGDGFDLREERSLTHAGQRVVKEVELRVRDGVTRRWREDVRLYERTEIVELARRSGLSVTGAFGDFDASAHDASSSRMIVELRRD